MGYRPWSPRELDRTEHTRVLEAETDSAWAVRT